jgi:hypothetical protein
MAITLPTDEGLPLFEELERVYKTIKPAVQAIYDSLGTVERIWLTNGVDAILAATPDNAVPLGQGTLTVAEWREVQRLFYALREWITTPATLSTDPEGTKPGPVPLVVISRRAMTPTGAGQIIPPPAVHGPEEIGGPQ